MTLPTTPKGTAKIQPGMGVKLFGFYYWAEEMRSRHCEGQRGRVRYDPENLGASWTYLGNRWVQCRPSVAFGLEGRTEKEMQIAVLELRRSRQLIGQRQSGSNRALAEFLRSAQAAKALRIQQAKDLAQRRISSAPSAAQGDLPQERLKVDPAPVSPPALSAERAAEPEPVAPQQPPEDYGDF